MFISKEKIFLSITKLLLIFFPETCSDLEATNLSSLLLAKFTFLLITYSSTIEICSYTLYSKKEFTKLRKRENMIGNRPLLRENDNLPHESAKLQRKSRRFLNVRALITSKGMRSKGAQCKTEV